LQMDVFNYSLIIKIKGCEYILKVTHRCLIGRSCLLSRFIKAQNITILGLFTAGQISSSTMYSVQAFWWHFEVLGVFSDENDMRVREKSCTNSFVNWESVAECAEIRAAAIVNVSWHHCQSRAHWAPL